MNLGYFRKKEIHQNKSNNDKLKLNVEMHYTVYAIQILFND